jgi:serine protease Do
MYRRLLTTGRVAGVTTLAVVAAIGLFRLGSPPKTINAAPAHTVASTAAINTLDALSNAFSDVAEHIKPSVVYVTAKRPGEVQQIGTDIPPEFRQFFDLPDRPRSERQEKAPMMASSGSGFIVSADGYILTNNHVVDGAKQVRVRLLDRREYDAKVVGTDPTTDVAVLKIGADHLTPAPLGSSDDTRVGEWVLAVGNPFGENLTFTVTSGIVSAKGRALELPNQSSRSIQDFIQTDAAINPGNSGGPLVNTRGEVIGINSAIASPTGTYSGYGFAVPIDLARKVMDQIVKSGHVSRAALGILARDASEEDAKYVGLDSIHGVLVEDFDDASPAKSAGLEPGDVIIAIDGQPVDYVAQLQERVAFRHPGDEVNVEVARKGGARKTIEVKLEAIKNDARTLSRANGANDSDNSANGVTSLGIQVTPLTADLADQLGLPETVQGLVVTDVDPESAVAGHLAPPDAGGPDVIESVEGQSVHTVKDLRRALADHQAGDIVSLRIYNGRAKAGRVERVQLSAGNHE